jgi:hypothetical protein
MFDPGPHFGLGTIFRPLDLIAAAAVAVAAIDKILGLWCVLSDHRPPGALALITPHGVFGCARPAAHPVNRVLSKPVLSKPV